jgi:D-alanyl-lipoteichoic acid acyltransferase DltB (MBOAT superfamily)
MNFPLLSVEFLSLSVAAIALLAALNGIPRQIAFLAVNVLFLWGLLLGPQGASSTIVFCVLGYVLVRFILRYPRLGFWIALCVYVGLFVYMRRYDFLSWVVPDEMLTRALSTIGLSFLFFKVVHVMIDARSGTLGTLQFYSFANYCLNFTTFVMGPIQRYQDFHSQWSGVKEAIPLTFEAHLDAVVRIFAGLVKIYILSVWFEGMALRSNTDLLELSFIGLFVQVYAFYFFLYLNFSGYCDVVIGVGSLMGVKPPENFNWPFVAQNISDFWLRQHRSLTLWLTDYVFSPSYKWALTNRLLSSHPVLAINGALMITMLVSGLWHGTTLSFFLFGVAHGLFLVVYRTWDALLVQKFGAAKVRAWRMRWPVRLSGIAITFNATAFAFIFFRLDTAQIEKVLSRFVHL